MSKPTGIPGIVYIPEYWIKGKRKNPFYKASMEHNGIRYRKTITVTKDRTDTDILLRLTFWLMSKKEESEKRDNNE